MKFDVMPVATPKQILEIEEAANHVWHNYYKDIFSPEQIDYMLKKYQSVEALQRQMEEQYVYYMLLSDDKLAGYMCFKIKTDQVYLSRLYIKAEFRRQGLARRTIAHFNAIFSSKEHGLDYIKSLKLKVERNNNFAINVYEHLGFQKIKSVDTNIGGGFVCREYVMERKVT